MKCVSNRDAFRRFQPRVRLAVPLFSKLTDNKALVDLCGSPPIYFTIAVSLCSENPAALNRGIQYTQHLFDY